MMTLDEDTFSSLDMFLSLTNERLTFYHYLCHSIIKKF